MQAGDVVYVLWDSEWQRAQVTDWDPATNTYTVTWEDNSQTSNVPRAWLWDFLGSPADDLAMRFGDHDPDSYNSWAQFFSMDMLREKQDSVDMPDHDPVEDMLENKVEDLEPLRQVVDACKRMVEQCDRSVAQALAKSTDRSLRPMIEGAVPAIRRRLRARLRFLGRYKLQKTVHQSETATRQLLQHVF